MWWMLVVIAVIAAGNVYGFAAGKGPAWVAVMMATFLALLAAGIGYGDASWHYPIARRQSVQFGVASVITAGTFALVYLTAYYIARRRPLRREQSMEHTVHPRHGKRQR
jgi:4-amino-4-deoxy-L-arabinose transferase-like glycosyltransferase